LLAGAWREEPTPEDQMHSDASGRHMVVVVFDDD
jgi:hypothetical protein